MALRARFLGTTAAFLFSVASAVAQSGPNGGVSGPGANGSGGIAAINAQTGTTYTVLASDRNKLVTFSNASAVAVSLPQATGAFGAGFCWNPQDIAGTVTIAPTISTINGFSSLVLTTSQGVTVCSDGTNWQIGYGGLGSGASYTAAANGGLTLTGTAFSVGTSAAGTAFTPPLNTVGNAQFGLETFGDSITVGGGATVPTTFGYAYLMQSDFAASVPFTNFGVSGTSAADANSSIFTNLNPLDIGNPITTLMIGTNDANNGFFSNVGYPTVFTALQMASAARASLSGTSTIAGNSTLLTQAGTWANDPTYPNLTGVDSTTNESTLTGSIIATNGVINLFYGWFATSGGTFTVAIDGTLATDTVTGNTTLASQPSTPFSASVVTRAVALARYAVSPGTHTVVVTVTSATSGSNTVAVFGFAMPPEVRNRGITGPRIFLAGTPWQFNDNDSTASAAANAATLNAANILYGDGLDVFFVDVRKYTNPTLDWAETALQNCPAAVAGANVHPNNCGHRHLANAFEDAINPINAPVGVLASRNTALGLLSLNAVVAGGGTDNTANGYHTLTADTTGNFNVANGSLSLASNTTGASNTANGSDSQFSNISGNNNSSNGNQTLFSNTTGILNTANGNVALFHNTTGGSNTANGAGALQANTTVSGLTADGAGALNSNTTGTGLAATGFDSLQNNTTGASNTADGYQSLQLNITGSSNTACGYLSLNNNSSGGNNTACGYESMFHNISGGNNAGFGYLTLFDVGTSQTAGAFNVGTAYTISSIGTTDFTLIGAASNTVGLVFTASGVGAGTGNATPNTVGNTAIGYNTGRGITYGVNNTIIGANVTGLAAGLTDAIIEATGEGTIRADFGNTAAGKWTFNGQINSNGIINPASAFTPTAGSGAASVAGNDQKFTVTTGTAQTSVTVNFGHTWGAAPTCALSSNSTASVIGITSESTSAITFGASVALTGGLINALCFGS
jgi:hypothetical protein